MDAHWKEDDTGAVLTDDGKLVGWLRIDYWYPSASADPTPAWVADSVEQDRVYEAAKRTDEHARHAVYIALTELLNWTYTLDSVLDAVWRKRLDATVKEQASKRVDAEIATVIQENHQRAVAHDETWTEPTQGSSPRTANARRQEIRIPTGRICSA